MEFKGTVYYWEGGSEGHGTQSYTYLYYILTLLT
jgi:hypothetical protein